MDNAYYIIHAVGGLSAARRCQSQHHWHCSWQSCHLTLVLLLVADPGMGSSPGEGVAAALSHRAEVFRSKLIEDFQILESISEQGKYRAPVYSSSDISSEFTPEL